MDEGDLAMGAPDITAEERVVVFELGTESYGIAVGQVDEIIRPPAITAVPGAPASIAGVINLRGRIIPVVDLRPRRGPPDGADGRTSRILVLRVGGKSIGAAVDAVSDVLRIPPGTIEPSGVKAHLSGIARFDDRVVMLLDAAGILDAAGVLRAA
jgi:purine-binding chemotaxis protein CheW